jgi:2',3'-cyclic-nucleotide 2'-phosphodiesterase (5'-nucleotidase family)
MMRSNATPRVWTALLTALLLGGLGGPSPSMAGETPPRLLTLLHTNDVHSRIEPIPATGDGTPELGGVARIKTLVDAIRAERGADNVLLVDAGDYSQGTLYWTVWQGAEAALLLNGVGYDAATLGNHEFNLGPDNLAARIAGEPLEVGGQRMPTLPYGATIVATNLDLSGAPALAAQVRPSTVIERAGLRFGVVGATTPTTANISNPGPGVVFLDLVDSLQAEVDRLHTDALVDHVILLSHLNHRDDLHLARDLSGVSIIVSGHDHVLLGDPDQFPDWAARAVRGPYPAVVSDRDGADTLVVSAWEWGRVLGRLDVRFDAEGRIAGWSGGPIPVDATLPDAPELALAVAAHAEPIAAFAAAHFGTTAMAFDGSRTPGLRTMETPLGNLIADATLEFDALRDSGAVAALFNGGGIRAGLPEGAVSFGDVLAVLPFSNSLVVVDLTGSELIAALDNGLMWAYDADTTTIRSSGAWPQVAGMTVHYCAATVTDLQAEPPRLPPTHCPDALRSGGVVIQMSVATADAPGHLPVDPAATYRIVTNDFLAAGGDYQWPLAQACADPARHCENSRLWVLDALLQAFERRSPVSHAVSQRLVPH